MKSSPVGKYLCACLALLLAHAAAAHGRTPPQAQSGGPAAPAAEWQEFTSEEGRFKVKFPASPQFRKLPFKFGPYTVDQHLHVTQLGDAFIFMVGYIDLLPGGSKNPERSFEGAITHVARGIVSEGGQVLSSGKVARGACEGREISGITKDPKTGQASFRHGQVFRSGLRAYVVLFMAAGTGEDPRAREMSRTFMESFAVADGCRAAIPPTPAPAPKTTGTVEGTPDAATGWRRIESAEQGFSVLVPGQVELETEQTRVVPAAMFRRTYVHTSDAAIYVVEVRGDYPPNFYTDPDGMQTMLDLSLSSARRGLEPFGVGMTHVRDLKLGPHAGREYALVSEKLGATVGRARLFITPKRIYSFVAVERDAARREENLERFFSSIRLEER